MTSRHSAPSLAPERPRRAVVPRLLARGAGSLRAVLRRHPPPPRRHPSPAVAAALARRRLIEEDRRRAPALLAELRALPPSERESIAAAAPRFRSVALVELLVADSLAAAAPDLAVLALRIAGLLDPSAVGAAQVEHLAAASWAAFADARRRAGNLVAAERAFECAARRLASDPDPMEEAAFCRLLALFPRDRGELRAALAAQWRAVRLLLAFAPPRAIRPALAELAGLLTRAWTWRARRGRRAPRAA